MSEKRPIIVIKKKKDGDHGHHGGAWKLAYADFVTAMMAFFLLLWLLNSTSHEQKLGISYYFEPIKMATKPSGGGGQDFFGGTSVNSKEQAETNEPSPNLESVRGGTNEQIPETEDVQDIKEVNTLQEHKDNLEETNEYTAQEEQSFKEIEHQIKQQIETNTEFADLAKNLIIEKTPEGLRIQIIDKDAFSMFSVGSSLMYKHAQSLVEIVSHAIAHLPNKITISGHTDSAPFPTGRNYTNWELSTDRANACRRVMVKAGINPKKITQIVGKESTDPLDKQNPEASINRRISIVLLHLKQKHVQKIH